VATLVPPSVRIVGTFLAVAVALGISATIAARSERTPVLRAVLRTVGIGVGTMVVTLALGSLLDFSQADVDL
jgi:VIT1/CCC1 family predicted Fe2+/Mn2+ transporter